MHSIVYIQPIVSTYTSLILDEETYAFEKNDKYWAILKKVTFGPKSYHYPKNNFECKTSLSMMTNKVKKNFGED